jgi:16S rRNA G966 N2-methylase RsmD
MNIEDKHRIIYTHFDFIEKHLNESAEKLLLKYHKKIPYVKILAAQIEAQHKIKDKWPEFYLNRNIVLPPLKNLAQSSSKTTAQLKFNFLKGKSAIDLTGGFGIDSMILSENFEQVIYVEQNQDLFEIASFNFKQIGKNNIICINESAENVLHNLSESVDLIYLDPSRKKEDKNVFMLHDLSPNFFEIQNLIHSKSKICLLKCSPLLDVDYIQQKLNFIEKIQAISVGGECKEINVLMRNLSKTLLQFEAICDYGNFQFAGNCENSIIKINQAKYIYDLDVACMVLKVNEEITQNFEVVHLNKTPFFISEILKKEFPGKIYTIIETGLFNKSFAQQIKGKSYSVKSRNYEENAIEIRQKLQLKESDLHALFVFRNDKKEAIYFITEKLNP